MNDKLLDKMARELLSGMGTAESVEIMDDYGVHVTDNDATLVVSDYEPVDVRELPNSTESSDLDAPFLDEEEGGPPSEEGEDADADSEVLGATRRQRKRHERVPFRDDFVDVMHRQAKAAVGPNGEILDEFDQRWQMQQGAHEAAVLQAPNVRINPVSARNGIIGDQKTLTVVPPNPFDPIQVAFWSSDDEIETTPVSVVFAPAALVNSSNGLAVARLRPFGRVRFGSRGAFAQVDVDITAGCQFTVPASEVSLQIGFDIPTGGGSAVTEQLTGMLSFMPIVRTAPITRTVYLDSVSGSASFFIPAFAKRVWLWRTPISEAVIISFQDSSADTVYPYTLAAGAYMFDPIPISGDVMQIAATFTGPVTLRFIFELCI